MTRTIARISGIALKTGVSRNNRLYTPEVIASAVKRAQQRIAEGTTPLSMLTHHAAGDDSTAIAGRVTRVWLDDAGSARYTADIPDTPHGRTIASLVDTSGGEPYLKGVSIRGAWLGPVKHKTYEGQQVEFADDLDWDGLDFTRSPGVLGAGIDTVTRDTPTRETDDGRTLIYESVAEARVEITETVDEKAPTTAQRDANTDGPYADPGYQSDGKRRYPLDTVAHAKSAWSYINAAKNASEYTAQQLKRIKMRVVKALRRFGVKVDHKEGWIMSTESVTEAGEIAAHPDASGSFAVNIDNGMVSITVSSYSVDPADLELAARAAMEGACAALAQIDPDDDGDIDTTASETDDDNMESTSNAAPVTETEVAPETPAPQPATENPTEQEPGVSEQPTTPAAETPAPTTIPTPATSGVTLSQEQFALLLSKLTPPAAPVAKEEEKVSVSVGAPAETAPTAPAPVAETNDAMVARMVAEGIKAGLATAVQEHVEQHGPPTRKGLVTQVSETSPTSDGSELPEGWPQKPLHEYTAAENKQYLRPSIEQAVLGHRSVYRDNA